MKGDCSLKFLTTTEETFHFATTSAEYTGIPIMKSKHYQIEQDGVSIDRSRQIMRYVTVVA